jgi:Zn-dependent protease/CBS domain-containing protein
MQRVVFGVIVAILFFVSMTLREFILNLAAYNKEKLPPRIILFGFGGVSWENSDSTAPANLPLLFIARFLSNLVIAAVFYGLYATFINAENLTMAGIAQWLAYIYFLVFLLHFIPAFPLDGGAILRLILWKSTGDYYKATRVASMIGWGTGLFLIFAGIAFFLVTRQWIISLVIVGLGWSIQIAAGDIRRQVNTHIALQNIKAQDIMNKEFPVIPGQANIRQLIREHILVNGWRYVMVVDDGKLTGLLTLKQIKSVPAKRWNNLTAGDIMVPAGKARIARPGQTADTLYEEMNRWGIDYMPVVEEAKIKGVVTRSALMDLVRTRAAFGL